MRIAAPKEKSARGRILVVENDARLARLLALRLSLEGWEVQTVGDGEAALATVRSHPVDVLLLDLRLPGLDGIGVLQRLSAEFPDPPPVVLMSGYLDRDSTMNAIRLGAAEVLEKPVEPAALCEVLRDVSSHGAARSERPPDDLGIVGASVVVERMREQIREVARFPGVPVLVLGETGTGKELVARAIHARSGGTKLVAINCAALPEHLFESELFGHVAGSFTGAKNHRVGLLEAAGDGTVFLDEIGELSPALQTKLLRVLETRRFRRVGSTEEQPLRARIISATNRELRGHPDEPLRTDLFFRLAGYTIHTPPLRVRMDDLPELAEHFLGRFAVDHGSPVTAISTQALCALRGHRWPGNIRELRTVLMTAMIGAGERIEVRHVMRVMHERTADEGEDEFTGVRARVIPAELPRDATPIRSFSSVEKDLLERAFQSCGGNLSLAARRLDMPRTTLRDRLKRYALI